MCKLLIFNIINLIFYFIFSLLKVTTEANLVQSGDKKQSVSKIKSDNAVSSAMITTDNGNKCDYADASNEGLHGTNSACPVRENTTKVLTDISLDHSSAARLTVSENGDDGGNEMKDTERKSTDVVLQTPGDTEELPDGMPSDDVITVGCEGNEDLSLSGMDKGQVNVTTEKIEEQEVVCARKDSSDDVYGEPTKGTEDAKCDNATVEKSRPRSDDINIIATKRDQDGEGLQNNTNDPQVDIAMQEEKDQVKVIPESEDVNVVNRNVGLPKECDQDQGHSGEDDKVVTKETTGM